MLVKVRCGPFPNYSGLGGRARHPALLDDRGDLHPPRRSGEARADPGACRPQGQPAGRTVSGWFEESKMSLVGPPQPSPRGLDERLGARPGLIRS